MSSTRTSAAARPAAARRPEVVVTAVAVVAVLQWILVLLFGWPSANSAPHDVPLTIAGPPTVVAQVTSGIDTAAPGAFTWTTVSDDAAARGTVLNRDSYAAVVLGPDGTTLYTASAASPAVASALSEQVPTAITAANPQAQVTVTDLVPNPAGDPRGTALNITLIPLIITSVGAGVLVGLLAGGRSRLLLALLVYAVAAGLLSTVALQGMLGALNGSWWLNAGVSALTCLAVAAGTAGLTRLAGPPGAAVSVFLLFFVAVPFSGAMSAWQLLPTPWGAVGQFLPAGAGATAVRSTAFFGGAGATTPLLVLAAWAVLGLALALLIRRGAATAVDAESTAAGMPG